MDSHPVLSRHIGPGMYAIIMGISVFQGRVWCGIRLTCRRIHVLCIRSVVSSCQYINILLWNFRLNFEILNLLIPYISVNLDNFQLSKNKLTQIVLIRVIIILLHLTYGTIFLLKPNSELCTMVMLLFIL
jgi:hypothetical protein